RLAGTAAVSVSGATNVVTRLMVFHRAVIVLVKSEPLRVSVNAGPVAVRKLGLKLPSDGAAATLNVPAFELTPSVVITVTLAATGLSTSDAGIAAVNSVGLPNEVVRFCPFHCTVTPPPKFVPITVSVKPADPAVCAVGFKLVTVGAAPMV